MNVGFLTHIKPSWWPPPLPVRGIRSSNRLGPGPPRYPMTEGIHVEQKSKAAVSYTPTILLLRSLTHLASLGLWLTPLKLRRNKVYQCRLTGCW